MEEERGGDGLQGATWVLRRASLEMEKDQPMTDKCIACGGPLNFTLQLILSSRGSSPRKQHSSKVIGVCDSCVNPNMNMGGNPDFVRLKQDIGVLLWMNRTDHRKKLEGPEDPSQPTKSEPDGKTAASGE